MPPMVHGRPRCALEREKNKVTVSDVWDKHEPQTARSKSVPKPTSAPSHPVPNKYMRVRTPDSGQAGRRGCRSRGLSEDGWEVGKGPLRGGAPQPLVALAGQPLHPVENMCERRKRWGGMMTPPTRLKPFLILGCTWGAGRQLLRERCREPPYPLFVTDSKSVGFVTSIVAQGGWCAGSWVMCRVRSCCVVCWSEWVRDWNRVCSVAGTHRWGEWW